MCIYPLCNHDNSYFFSGLHETTVERSVEELVLCEYVFTNVIYFIFLYRPIPIIKSSDIIHIYIYII